jgi:UMF1 family MFS transporter
VFAIAIGQTGSSRGAILWVIAFFVIGGAILALVDVKEGERAARAADVNLRAV